MAWNNKPNKFHHFTWIDENGERQDYEKRKLKEENFSLRKKIESMSVEKAALIQATSRYKTERNEFEYKNQKLELELKGAQKIKRLAVCCFRLVKKGAKKIMTERSAYKCALDRSKRRMKVISLLWKKKIKIVSAQRKEKLKMIKKHKKAMQMMTKKLSVQNDELNNFRDQLVEVMDELNELLTNHAIKSTINHSSLEGVPKTGTSTEGCRQGVPGRNNSAQVETQHQIPSQPIPLMSIKFSSPPWEPLDKTDDVIGNTDDFQSKSCPRRPRKSSNHLTTKQDDNNEHDKNKLNVILRSPVASPSQKLERYESPLKHCSSIANCARVLAKKKPKLKRKFQRVWKKLQFRQPKKFKCGKCTLHFLHLAHLKRHMIVDHRKPRALQDVVSGCRECGLLFKKREDHALHFILIHVNGCNVDTRTLTGYGYSEKMKDEVDDSDIDIEN